MPGRHFSLLLAIDCLQKYEEIPEGTAKAPLIRTEYNLPFAVIDDTLAVFICIIQSVGNPSGTVERKGGPNWSWVKIRSNKPCTIVGHLLVAAPLINKPLFLFYEYRFFRLSTSAAFLKDNASKPRSPYGSRRHSTWRLQN
jgi:hypothetical protein